MGLVKVLIIIFLITVVIYFVKNNKEIFKKIEENKGNKKWKVLSVILLCSIIGLYSVAMVKEVKRTISNVDFYTKSYANTKMFASCDVKIEAEKD